MLMWTVNKQCQMCNVNIKKNNVKVAYYDEGNQEIWC